MTVNMAKKMLPHQCADIDAIVAEYRNKWEANSDIDLAKKIILQNSSPSDDKQNKPTSSTSTESMA